MFCENCGAKLPDEAVFCPGCGTRAAGASASPPPQDVPQGVSDPQTTQQAGAQYAAAGGASAAAPRKYRHFPFGTIVAVVVLAAAVWLLFAGGREDPVSDLKGITFDAYDTTCTLGEAVAKNTSHAGWQSAKETDGSYLVTLDCVEKMYGMSLKVTFSVTYTDDWVYGRPTAVYFSGDSYTDSTSMTAAMMLLYGQLDEQGMSELMAYDMLWDVLG